MPVQTLLNPLVISDAGLVLDIAGAVLLWKFGLPESLNREGRDYIYMENEDIKAKAVVYDRWGRLGLGALVIGFALQLIGNHV